MRYEKLFSGIDMREKMRQDFLEKYDEEDVEYLMETWGNPLKNYHRITFINDGIGDIKKNRDITQHIAVDAD
jgi:hypothetical protein